MTTLVLGGAASGKSEYAERLVETAFAVAGGSAPLWYIATMSAPDDESRERIRKHRDRRTGKGYETAECPDGKRLAAFADALNGEDRPVLLLDDFGNLVANELFAGSAGREARVQPLVDSLKTLHRKAGTLVLVTNDVFGDGPSDDPGVDRYLRFLAQLNRDVAAFAENVCEVTAGLPDYYKGGNHS